MKELFDEARRRGLRLNQLHQMPVSFMWRVNWERGGRFSRVCEGVELDAVLCRSLQFADEIAPKAPPWVIETPPWMKN